MPLLQSPPTRSLPLPFSQSLFSFPRNPIILFRKPPIRIPKKSISISSCSVPKALPLTEQEILQSITESDGDKEKKSLPGIRIYENDMARLNLIGDVSFEQALTAAAAAADGGEAADEHIVSGISTMVVETVFPGPLVEHSTVSTRLFMPATKVKEKARKLRNTLPKDMLSSMSSRNILALTFRQVVLQCIWSFELELFAPGAERNRKILKIQERDLMVLIGSVLLCISYQQVPAFSTLSSSDERFLSVLAEAICMSCFDSTEMDFCENSLGTSSNNIFCWFQKPGRVASKDFSVVIYKLSQDEIIENAKKFLENFNKENYIPRETKRKHRWWTSSTYSKLERIGGPEFITWTSEYVPAYRIQVDAYKFDNSKFEGWKKSAENMWEILLTHSQMFGLADILDMYYEDLYTLPDKQFSSGVVTDFTNLSKNKRITSLWKMLSITLASGVFVVSISILSQIYWPHFNKTRVVPSGHSSAPMSEFDCSQHESLEATELEDLCISIVKKIKDGVGWPGEITTESDFGAWAGELPNYLRRSHDTNLVPDVISSHREDTATHCDGNALTSTDFSSFVGSVSDESNTDMKTSAQDIASYQVVLSKGGNIIGFQPTSRIAVNHWASNPLAKELYDGRKLSPGLVEPGLKIPRPEEIVVVELLMSLNPNSWFVLARPFQ